MAEPVLCPACACACDDLSGPALAAACARGGVWFAAAPTDLCLALVAGAVAEPPVAKAGAASLLIAARAPAVYGLTGLPLEAQRSAVALADALGALLIPAPSLWSPARRAMQDVGLVTATWGEVRHRAELVVFWNVDPDVGHPRWRERFLDAPATLLDRPREVVMLEPGEATLDGLVALRLALSGKEPASERWASLAAKLKAARSAAIVFGEALAAEGRWACKALFELVRDLNIEGRCVAVPLGSGGNVGGLESALTWQTGWAEAVDFGGGAPRPAVAPFAADVVIAVGPAPLPAELAGSPVIRLAPHLDATAAVSLRVRDPGRTGGGTWFRGDEVPLPLRPFQSDAAPDAAALLAELALASRRA